MDPRSAASQVAAGLASLCSMLWQERASLELILFKLVAEELIAARGNARFLRLADEELRQAADILRENEVLRAAETQMLADLLGLPADASLAELADRAEEPWSGLLREHRNALRSLLADIQTAAAANRKILLAGAESAGAALDQAGSVVSTYDTHGGRVLAGPAAWRLDRQA